jgi:hypothetical protein
LRSREANFPSMRRGSSGPSLPDDAWGKHSRNARIFPAKGLVPPI